MVALGKIFATAMALGAAIAAPLGSAVADAPTAMALEARPNHNPSAARITRGFNDRTVVLMMAFTTLPANIAGTLSAQGYEAMRQAIQAKFMNFIAAQNQNTALQNVWNGLIQGLNGGSVESVARSYNGEVQFQLVVELGQASNLIITNYIVGPLTAYLQNAGVNVVQQSANLGGVQKREEAEPLTDRSIAPKCAAANYNLLQYLNNNPPAIFNGNLERWCR